MAQSLANILLHVVFSTKNRAPILKDDIRDELHAYIGGIAGNLSGALLKAGSTEDHIHLLIAHPRICSPADLVKEIKTGSSKWLKSRSSDFMGFHWQSSTLSGSVDFCAVLPRALPGAVSCDPVGIFFVFEG